MLQGVPDVSQRCDYHFIVILKKEAKYLCIYITIKKEKQKINQECNMFKKWQSVSW